MVHKKFFFPSLEKVLLFLISLILFNYFIYNYFESPNYLFASIVFFIPLYVLVCGFVFLLKVMLHGVFQHKSSSDIKGSGKNKHKKNFKKRFKKR